MVSKSTKTDMIDVILAHQVKLGAASHWQWECLGCGAKEVVTVPGGDTPTVSADQVDELQAYGGAEHLSMMLQEAGYLSLYDAMDIADQSYEHGYERGYYDHKDGNKYRPQEDR